MNVTEAKQNVLQILTEKKLAQLYMNSVIIDDVNGHNNYIFLHNINNIKINKIYILINFIYDKFKIYIKK